MKSLNGGKARIIACSGSFGNTVVPMTLHYLFPRQAQQLLQKAGLRVRAMWGDYTRAPYTADSEKLIILAEK